MTQKAIPDILIFVNMHIIRYKRKGNHLWFLILPSSSSLLISRKSTTGQTFREGWGESCRERCTQGFSKSLWLPESGIRLLPPLRYAVMLPSTLTVVVSGWWNFRWVGFYFCFRLSTVHNFTIKIMHYFCQGEHSNMMMRSIELGID